MSLLTSAPALLAVLAGVLTLVSGLTNPSKLPLWIPLLLLCIAIIVIVIPK
jgi:hypothetical protein